MEDNDETSDSESEDTEEKKTHEKDGDVKSKEGGEDDLLRERFFDFIFEVEEFFDEEEMKKLKKYEEEAKEELRREKLKLMDSESLRDRVNLLNINHKGKDKLLYMKFCSDECIHAISECCHSIITDRFKFNQKQLSKIKRKFKPITRDLRRLVKQSTSIQRKRKILQKPQVGNGVLGIIASLVIPALMKLFVK